MTFLAGDPNTLLIGGHANDAAGAIYSIVVVRDGDGHITGFTGTAELFAAAPYIDGGLLYGPANVLFYTRHGRNEIGEIETGSTTADRVVDLTPLGVSSSVGGLFFVLEGLGLGEMKIVSFDTGEWYSARAMSDAMGTYDFLSVTLQATVSGGPEGIAFVLPGSPVFPANSMLLAERSGGVVASYDLDANGNPISASRTEFITNMTGAEGAVVDPATGDFLFSTFGGEVVVVRAAQPAEPTATVGPDATPTVTTNPAPTVTPVPAAPAALPDTGVGGENDASVVWSALLAGVGLVAAATGLAGLRRRRRA